MESIKLYIIKIIVVVAVLQIGGFFINIRSYNHLYSLVGGVILIATIFSAPGIKIDTNYLDLSHKEEIPAFEDTIENTFETRVEEMIAEGLHKKYKTQCRVEVDTDFEKLKINVFFDNELISNNEIYNYIKNTYCTEKDKVVINNEENFGY